MPGYCLACSPVNRSSIECAMRGAFRYVKKRSGLSHETGHTRWESNLSTSHLSFSLCVSDLIEASTIAAKALMNIVG